MNNTLIIIGAGLAGMAAALTAAARRQPVCLVSALPSERAQSVMAEGGINAALNTKDEYDSPEQHFADTLAAGCDLADPNAVWDLTQAAPSVVQHLADMGVPFNRAADGYSIDQRYFGGQKKRRTAFVQSDTGKQLVTALIDAVRCYERQGCIHRLDHHAFVTLRLSGTTCCGAVVCNTYTGEQLSLAGPVIIAAGGMHGLFGNTTGSLLNTGAVTAELLRLGVPLANLEFIQYHPTAITANGKRMLISEAARGEGGRLYTETNGRRSYFMEETYPQLGNLMPRDITAREIDTRLRRGQTVCLDMTALPPAVWQHKLAGLADDCATYAGIDITKEPLPVQPAIHYFMGGLWVNRQHRTAFSHLYGAGECCAQYHGANRLGGNSLLGAIYGGMTAAGTACRENGSLPEGTAAAVPPPISRSDLVRLHQILDMALGIIRTGDALRAALTELQSLAGTLSLLGQAAVQCALYRQESRGAHFRADYPERNDTVFRRTTRVQYDGRQLHLSLLDIPERL